LNQFKIAITDGAIDFERIAKSGQMFRWQSTDFGWQVQDGNAWYQVQNDLSVASNREKIDFEMLLRLDVDHAEKLAEIIQKGPELEPFIKELSGLRMMRPASAVETFFSFLCTANNHVSRITTMVHSLASFGEMVDGYRAFPSIQRIAAIQESELRERGFGYRGKSIPVVAQQILDRGGDNYLGQLKEFGHQKARAQLMTLPSIGPKLADCICLFAFDHGESVPVDTHIWQALTRLYFPDLAGLAVTKDRYQTVTQFFQNRFGNLAGAAHQFLFVENMNNARTRRNAVEKSRTKLKNSP
jgi:N-glycosylase/DNA lyase